MDKKITPTDPADAAPQRTTERQEAERRTQASKYKFRKLARRLGGARFIG